MLTGAIGLGATTSCGPPQGAARLSGTSTIVYVVTGCSPWPDLAPAPEPPPGSGPSTTHPPVPKGPSCDEAPAVANVTFRTADGGVSTERAVLPWRSAPQELSVNDEANLSAVLVESDRRGVRCRVEVEGRGTDEEFSLESCRVIDTVRGLLTPEPPGD